jgi:hypothetical protein
LLPRVSEEDSPGPSFMVLTRSSTWSSLRVSLYPRRGKIQNSPYGRRGRYAYIGEDVKYILSDAL